MQATKYLLHFWKLNIPVNAASRKLICFHEQMIFFPKTVSDFKIKFKQWDLVWILETVFLENISAKQ